MFIAEHSHDQSRANKTDAGNGSYGICRVIDASRSPSPDPSRKKMKNRIKKIILTSVVIALITYSILFLNYGSDHPDYNLGYITWKHGYGSYEPSYVYFFGRDLEYRNSFIGLDLEELRKKFPNITRGSEFPTESYRGVCYPPGPTEDADDRFWFDDDPNGWGLSVDTKDGKIKRFSLIKG